MEIFFGITKVAVITFGQSPALKCYNNTTSLPKYDKHRLYNSRYILNRKTTAAAHSANLARS